MIGACTVPGQRLMMTYFAGASATSVLTLHGLGPAACPGDGAIVRASFTGNVTASFPQYPRARRPQGDKHIKKLPKASRDKFV